MTERNLSNWLEYYLKYTQNSEPPTQYHLWSGIAAISSCLRRKCWSYWAMSGSYVYPNFYIALVGPPGGRKGTAMKFAKEMLYDISIPLSSDCLGSVQALYKELMDSKDTYIDDLGNGLDFLSLSAWSEEFQVFLSDSTGLFIKNITDLFDCPKRWKYSTLKRNIEDLSNCWLTIIGAITPDLLQENLTNTAVGGGLFSRIIFVVGYGKAKKVALGFLSKEEQELETKLIQDLELISNMKGQFKLTSEFIDLYVPWYNSSDSTEGVDSDKFVGYNDRRALHLKKLCMIFSAAESNNMLITGDHFHLGINTLKYTESEMGNAFYGLGRGAHAGVITSLMRALEVNGTMTWPEILMKFQLDAMPSELVTFLGSLETIGKIKVKEDTNNVIHYIWNTKNKANAGLGYLNNTVFKQMDNEVRNVN